MSKTKVEVNRRALTVVELWQVAAVVLKLTGVVDWSWWWVFAPTLLSVAVLFLLFVGWGIVTALSMDRRYGR